MLSVFNSKRSKSSKQSRKFSTIAASIRARPQSPPSPASFASPEIVEINEKGPFGATYPDSRGPSTSIERSVTSPQIQLEFDTTESLTDWLSPTPSTAPPPENRTPPKRNVSLPNGVRPLPEASSSLRGRGSPEAAIKEEPEPQEVRPIHARSLCVIADAACSGIAYSLTRPCTTLRVPRTRTMR